MRLTSAVNPKTDKLQFWHKRLCHQNKKHVQEFLQREGIDVPTDDYFCEACAFGKSHHLPFHNRSCRDNQPGEIIHADVYDPINSNHSVMQIMHRMLRLVIQHLVLFVSLQAVPLLGSVRSRSVLLYPQLKPRLLLLMKLLRT